MKDLILFCVLSQILFEKKKEAQKRKVVPYNVLAEIRMQRHGCLGRGSGHLHHKGGGASTTGFTVCNSHASKQGLI
jgi:hypothetical protein